MHLGLMIKAEPQAAAHVTAERLVRAAVAGGWRVSIFFMDNGVYAMERYASLLQDESLPQREQLRLAVCAHNCDERGHLIPAGVKSGSQADWARIVEEAERVMVFG